MLIQNYGLFWRRQNVFWGRPGKAGHLQGHPAGSAFVVVDFRNQQGVYCLYDDNFKMIYVGQAGANDKQRLFDRLKQHCNDSLADRWTRFSWFGIRWVTKANLLAAEAQNTNTTAGAVLNHIEAILISAAEPPNNLQSGRFGEDVIQYLQWRDAEQLGPTVEDMIKDIWKTRIPE
ncbi:MAG: GIY-YIG nuclease family protein [Xanthobacteraceae bacterium]|nr:GIY-YIG nuclease family protein [Xanthobacteraceae bacterium]